MSSLMKANPMIPYPLIVAVAVISTPGVATNVPGTYPAGSKPPFLALKNFSGTAKPIPSFRVHTSWLSNRSDVPPEVGLGGIGVATGVLVKVGVGVELGGGGNGCQAGA